MKINPKYSIKKVGGKNILVADNTMRMEGIITINDTAEFIWKMIEKGAEAEEIATALADECNAPVDEIRGDVNGFIEMLKGAGIIE